MRFLDVLLRNLPKKGRVLDLGCGPGSMLDYLGKYGEVTGLDSYLPALDMARSHFGGELVAGDCCRLPFPDNEFSLVFAGEVLYHRSIVDLSGAVDEFVRVLESGGHLVVVDSAYASCYSQHDMTAHGARRFSRSELVSLFSNAGMQVQHSTYAYLLLLPLVWVVRRWKSIFRVDDKLGGELSATWSPLNRLLICWFTLEASIAGRWGLPLGLSIQVLGRKNAHSTP